MLQIPALLIALGCGLLSGLSRRGAPRNSGGWPGVTLSVFAMVAIGYAVQCAFPPMLGLLARDPRMLHQGEIWRVFTALFVQDGGLAGALFNLTTLLLLGTISERWFGPVRWLVLYFGGGMIVEWLALAWQPHGAGNSIACFALAGAMVFDATRERRTPLQAGLALGGLSAGIALLAIRDIHGLAYATGVIIAAILLLAHRHPVPNPR